MGTRHEIVFETDDIRIDSEALSDAIKQKPGGTYMIVLDEHLPPWGARLTNKLVLGLGSAAKADCARNCPNTTAAENN